MSTAVCCFDWITDNLRLVGIRHILATPYHPQTNGKLERYLQTIKRDVNQVPYELPSDLDAAIASFVSYYCRPSAIMGHI